VVPAAEPPGDTAWMPCASAQSLPDQPGGVPRRTRPLGPLATGLASEPPSHLSGLVGRVVVDQDHLQRPRIVLRQEGRQAGAEHERLVPSRDDDRNRGPRRGVGGDRQPHPVVQNAPRKSTMYTQMISGTAASHTTGRTLEEGLVSARLWNELRPRGHGDPPASRSPPISCRRGRLPRHLEAVSASRSCQASSNGRAMQTSGG